MFEIGDVLPPKIKIYFDTTKHLTTPIDFQSMGLYGVYDSSATSTIILIPNPSSPLWGDLDTNFVYANWTKIYDITTKTWLMESIICDLSQYAPTERTMAHIYGTANVLDFIAGMTWELNTYTITYNSNGGSSVSQATGVTTLPSTLPTTTRAGYTFVAWYIDSALTTRAVAGETIEEDTTLYAKWHNLGSLFTEIADAIRSKDGTSENIRDVDFGERVKQIQGAKEEETKTVTPNFASGNVVVTPTSGKVLSQITINKDTNHIASNIAKDKTIYGVTGTSYIAIELTQAQYDALGTKDTNTYYLING